MVSSIADPTGTDANGESYWDSESAVTIMESVYNNHNEVFGVVKSRTLNDIADNVNDKKWEIWRLKSK